MKYISWLDSFDEKVKTFICFAGKGNTDNVKIKIFLNELGGAYSEIADQKGLRPKLEINEYNKRLVQFLMRVGFISSYKGQDGTYQVNTRKI